MAIVSSAYTFDGPAQANGKQDVVETHTDSDGGTHVIRYRAPAGADYQAIANARAAVLAAQLAENEFQEIING